jgi:hypothetical protein
MKFMRLLMFGTVMLMANRVGAQNSVKPFPLDEATISDVHAAYKSGALTSVKLVQAYLERIRACDQAGPKLNVAPPEIRPGDEVTPAGVQSDFSLSFPREEIWNP